MKKPFLLVLLLAGYVVAVAQNMHVKKHNLSHFYTDEKVITKALEKQSSDTAKRHPEYGITPYNAQCNNCDELIDQRTQTSRQYIDRTKPNYLYSQQSYYPLHYKKFEGDVWHTIDRRLRPDATQPGVYTAPNQPAPTKCDLINKTTSIKRNKFEFVFNHDLQLFFYDENKVYTKPERGNYNNYTIGEEGLFVKNMWPGVDMEQVFAAGEIETNYRIEAPLQVPITEGYMVIEDHFTLPAGYRIIELHEDGPLPAGFRGDLLILDDKNDTAFIYRRPVYLDANVVGTHGIYQWQQHNNNYNLQMLVPIDWLTRKENVYPLLIDPTVIVQGDSINGHYRTTGLAPNGQGFTTKPAYCPYQMTVQVPGRSKLLDTYVELEYQLTYDNACGTPPLPAPYCTFSQVTQEVICDHCNTTTGLLACNPALPPYTGTCTTDSQLVNGAKPLHVTVPTWVPNYTACYPPQCPDYFIDFSLRNRDSTCGDVCGFLCARGNLWGVTVTACRVEGYITQDKTSICPGESVTFLAHPDCGVPPYHYLWTQDGGNTYDTVYNSPYYGIYPQTGKTITCLIVDTCGELYITNDLSVAVTPAPPADAGPNASACAGNKTIQLGGNPTTSPGTTVQWIAETPTIQSWISNANAPNPVLTIPAGVIDTFWVAVRCSAAGFSCAHTDTMYVFSHPLPTPVLSTTGATQICGAQNVTLQISGGNYTSYNWSNGAGGQSTVINQPGQYYAVVTDANGCTDTSNTISITAVAVPTLDVRPDTTLIFGDSVMLYTDLDLNAASIDSFNWYPFINMSCATCTNPVVSPENAQIYGLNVYVSGCTISDSVLIRVILPNNFYIPNAFTPNNDGNNDVFYVLSQSGVKVITFQIFDRIGEKVHDGTYPWDGTYKGKPAPPGVYVYVCRLGLFGEDQAIFRKGSVTLIR